MFKYHCSSLDGLPSRHVLLGCRNYGLRPEAAGGQRLQRQAVGEGESSPTTEVGEGEGLGVG